MATRKEVMVEQVKIEAKNLRKHATKQELNKLKFTKLNPDLSENCIYGQITGNCTTDRACELIDKCSARVYKTSNIHGAPGSEPINAPINGKAQGANRRDSWLGFSVNYWSPIEVFIQQKGNQENGNNKMLIDYLKGKTNRLNFKKFY